MTKVALLGIALTVLVGACTRHPQTLSLRASIEEPSPTIADTLSRHFEPLGVTIVQPPSDDNHDDPEAVLEGIQHGDVEIGIVEEPALRVSGLATIAPLYPSILHVLHRRDRTPRSLPELFIGQQIYAGPPNGPAYRLMLQFAADYGLSEADFTVLPDPWRVEPDVWFVLGDLLPLTQQEALSDYTLFGFGDVERLGSGTPAEGLALKYPNVRPFVLPEAVYAELTDGPLLTLATRTVLVAREDLDPDVAYFLAREIFENAHIITAVYPLASDELYENFEQGALALPLHPGARRYVDKDEPTMLERYAEVVGVGLTVVAALVSGLLAAWRLNKVRRKDEIDVYYRRVLAVRRELDETKNNISYNELSNKVKQTQEEVFNLLIAERLNVDESLTLFLGLSTQVLNEIAVRREQDRPAGS